MKSVFTLKRLGASFFIGLLIALAGLATGLQFSPPLANIMLFPIILASLASGIAFGNFPPWLIIFFLLLTALIWAVIIAILYDIINRKIINRKITSQA